MQTEKHPMTNAKNSRKYLSPTNTELSIVIIKDNCVKILINKVSLEKPKKTIKHLSNLAKVLSI
jgi:hypothetical protein